MAPSISEGRDLDYDLISSEPKLVPLKAEHPSGELIEVDGKQGLVYGEDKVTIVGDVYQPVSHLDLFPPIHEEVMNMWPARFWKVETATGMNGAQARVTWFFWGEDASFDFGVPYGLCLRSLNSYDGDYPIAVELALVNTDHGGRIPLLYTRKKKRHRGKNLVSKVIPEAEKLLKNAESLIEERIRPLHEQRIEGEEVDQWLSQLDKTWVPLGVKSDIKLRFEADEMRTVLDLVALVGQYANRVISIYSRIMYRQERIYWVMADAANLV